MKLSLLTFLFSFAAFGLEAPAPVTPKPFDMLKCTSERHGTVWASFGRAMLSGQDQVRYFATEVAVFSPDIVSRLVYLDYKKSLDEVDVLIRPGQARLAFTVPNEGSTREHYITILQYDRMDYHSYVGNWKVTNSGEAPVHDQVFCTLN